MSEHDTTTERLRKLEFTLWGVQENNGLRGEFRNHVLKQEKDMEGIRQEIRDVTTFQTKLIGARQVLQTLAACALIPFITALIMKFIHP